VIIGLNNHRPKDKVKNQKRGFTLVEVLVGILLMAAFTGTAMQAIVSATAFKVKAEELSEATVWMQEDLELVRYQASKVAAVASKCSASKADDGYAKALKDEINSPSTDSTPKTSAIGQRPYTLMRKADPKNEQPYNVLMLNYSVTRPGDSTPIAQLYSEVIPDAFLSCP
jgi:prepilin-type N-terminal cleavage/methylation domain-containing protein